MSTSRLMILGLLKRMQPAHGYDVKRELESWQAHEWANIAPGSIYHALRKLSEDGLLEEVTTEQVGSRPARSTYRTTPKGDLEFEELLRRQWWEYSAPVDPFLSGRHGDLVGRWLSLRARVARPAAGSRERQEAVTPDRPRYIALTS
jgi:DNA-binding PadR family transcriptional regulator